MVKSRLNAHREGCGCRGVFFRGVRHTPAMLVEFCNQTGSHANTPFETSVAGLKLMDAWVRVDRNLDSPSSYQRSNSTIQ